MVDTRDVDMDGEDRTADMWPARQKVIKTMGRIEKEDSNEKGKTVVG